MTCDARERRGLLFRRALFLRVDSYVCVVPGSGVRGVYFFVAGVGMVDGRTWDDTLTDECLRKLMLWQLV